jgi:hypothetical protein
MRVGRIMPDLRLGPEIQSHHPVVASPTPNLLKPGETLGPCRVDALIGKGGMGEVCRGTDTRLGRSVAIKVSAMP